MRYFADLHVHSKYSRATSRDCDLEHLSWWAQRKGIEVVGTGDFTHPAWWEELRTKLVPAEPGLYRLRPDLEREVAATLPAACRLPTRFMLEVEISTIYKKGEKTRKIHHLIYAAHFETAGKFRERLGAIGNIASDGRPILGLDSRHLLEIALESGPDAYLIPAHVWTPWFAVLGSMGGFDAIEDCYGDLSSHVFAIETGLSSDPEMIWRVSQLDRYTLISSSDAHSPPKLGREASVFDTELDYFALRRALETGEGHGGTVEFFPEEGKYHLDGHRACGVCLEPEATRELGGRCPECGKALTIGVLHRVEDLADHPVGRRSPRPLPFRSLVPLPEILGEIRQTGAGSKTVAQAAAGLAARFGPELQLLEQMPLEEVVGAGDPVLAEALARLRAGRVLRQAGYDGEYGVIRLFSPGELEARMLVAPLFALAPREVATPAAATAPARPALAAADSSTVEPAAPEVPGGLDPWQEEAASILAGPLLIVAGPGTGKTRTLTHRLARLVADQGVPPQACLAVTFSRRAAGELAERLAALLGDRASDVFVTTFHGLGLEILRRWGGVLGLPAEPRVADPTACLALAGQVFTLPPPAARSLLREIGRFRRARAVGATPPDGSVAAQAETFSRALHAAGRVDFDDLLVLPLELLASSPEVLAACYERWRYLSIDEYQDVDPLQYQLVRLLAPGAANLCAIGDPDQSIYRFRGSDVGFFLRFEHDYPAARVVQLERSYRSTPIILGAALQAVGPASLVAGRRLQAVRGGGQRIQLVEAANERAEAELVAHTIEKLVGGTSYFSVDSGRVEGGATGIYTFADFAVLYRTDAQSGPLLEALGRAGIPVQKRSHEALAERPGVLALLAELERAEAGAGGVDARLLAAFERLASADSGAMAAASPGRTELVASYELLRPLAAVVGDDFEGFRARVTLGTEVDLWDPRAERVSLLTLHAAKGLEFPVVLIVGCEDGLLPLRFPGGDDAEALAEERRLFFVGLTRARERLVLTHASRRQVRGEAKERQPSPFLLDVEAALIERERTAERPARRPKEDARQLRLL